VTAEGGRTDGVGPQIALTGATGFLGSHIADTLLARGYGVRASIRPTSNLRWLQGKPVTTVQVDLADPVECRRFLDGTTGLIHCAGVVSAPAEKVYQLANVTTTACLLEAAASAWAGRDESAAFVLISSLAAHGPAALNRPAVESDACRPITAYGRSKLAAEELLAARPYAFRTVILRPPSLYGPRDADFLPLFRLALRGWTGRLGRRLGALSLVHGADAAEAAVALLETKAATGPYFVDDGRAGYDWSAMAEALGQMAGRNIRTLTIPLALLKLVAQVVGRTRASRSPVLNPDRIRDLDTEGWVCDGGHLVQSTGFQARWDAPRGFTETLDFYLKERWL
jgi:nucleoside-diphosphate-sugar epimerase